MLEAVSVVISVTGGNILDEEWRSAAACRGPRATLFFAPLTTERKSIRLARERQAKAVCKVCPVRVACLAHALDAGEPHGVWGGLSESERAGILARRQAGR